MSDFDPYHQWLGIPPQEQPAHHYRLLGITDFESDRGVISAAAERQTVYLRMLQAGEHAVLVAELLNEVSQARVTLLNVDQKAAYDEELRKQQTPEPVPEPTPPPIPVVKTPEPPPTPVVVRGTVTQEFPVSVVQPAKRPRRSRQKKIWKRVIGISVVGVIGVCLLVISMMSSGAPITNTIGMTLNKILAGTFTMGSPKDEPDRGSNETQHEVTITKAFYMQTTEVTQGQWTAVMGTEPWKGKQYVKEGPNYAATHVSWDDAVAYCKKLSEKEGTTYRLPTEAEWEYACRAGTKTTWSFGDDEKVLGDYAWYKENAWDIDEKYAHQVGLKKPNAFGLHDMHGNVFEWCHDYYDEVYYKQSSEIAKYLFIKDPTGPVTGSDRVLRGGSWIIFARLPRSAVRGRLGAVWRYDGGGFRLVRELD